LGFDKGCESNKAFNVNNNRTNDSKGDEKQGGIRVGKDVTKVHHSFNLSTFCN
jgi:hypothetical protein